MVLTLALGLVLFFHPVNSIEPVSATTLKFLIDFLSEKEMSSIQIIKEDESGRESGESKDNETKFIIKDLLVSC